MGGQSKSSAESEDGTQLVVPTELPMLALDGQVLLPTAHARISVSAKSSRSMALIEHLLQQRGSNVLVAVVPLVAGSVASGKVPPPSPVAEAPDRKHARGKHSTQPSQRDRQRDDMDPGRVHALGTAARVLRLTRSAQSGNWVLDLQGCCRVRVNGFSDVTAEYYTATVQQLEAFDSSDTRHDTGELDAEGQEVLAQLRRAARQLLGMVSLTSGAAAATRMADMLEAAPPGRCADLLAAVLMPPPATRLAVLDAVDVKARLQLALSLVKDALKAAGQAVGALGDSATAFSSAGGDDKASVAARVAALRRLQAAQKGLQGGSFFTGAGPRRRSGSGDGGEDDEELVELANRVDKAAMPAEAHKVAIRELKRLQRSSEQHPGYAISRTYLETLVDLPWNRFAARPPMSATALAPAAQHDGASCSQGPAQQHQAQQGGHGSDAHLDSKALEASDSSSAPDDTASATPGFKELSLSEARVLLDQHHHGLNKVKRRIVQYLAVRRLRGPDACAPIIAFVGPPGVGKTSLARSVAEALGRPFQRISLGGVRDEAEVRGHRRTYIGALPGRIIQAVRRAGVRDGLLLLDEVDKMGRDARGDPAAALLEVLDPEQNSAFVDTYLGVPFDLSKVVFLATANQLGSIPLPLLDRLEVIHLSGYTLDEKVHIAEQHLIPKLLEEHGLTRLQLHFPSEALHTVACGYTREAGVRSLSRALAAICRHVAVDVVEAADCGEHVHQSAAENDSSEYDSPQQAADISMVSGGGSVIEATSACGRHGAQHFAARQAAASHVQLQQCSSAMAEDCSADNGFADMTVKQVVVDGVLIEEVLGPRRFSHNDAAQRIAGAGSAAGLVWTQAGGQVQYVECIATGHGQAGHTGGLTLTGQMGDVLEESARIALSWIRAHAAQLPLLPFSACNADTLAAGSTGTDVEAANGAEDGTERMQAADASATGVGASNPTNWDVHLHLPAGAVPKDGPSAGVTLAVALASLFTGRPARADTAMTGELTLRGLVLPVGGVKDKLIAAHQAGMTRVIIPKRNLPDVKADLPAAVRDALQVIPAERLEEVLANAFDPPLALQHRSKL